MLGQIRLGLLCRFPQKPPRNRGPRFFRRRHRCRPGGTPSAFDQAAARKRSPFSLGRSARATLPTSSKTTPEPGTPVFSSLSSLTPWRTWIKSDPLSTRRTAPRERSIDAGENAGDEFRSRNPNRVFYEARSALGLRPRTSRRCKARPANRPGFMCRSRLPPIVGCADGRGLRVPPAARVPPLSGLLTDLSSLLSRSGSKPHQDQQRRPDAFPCAT